MATGKGEGMKCTIVDWVLYILGALFCVFVWVPIIFVLGVLLQLW
jgi:hypothetical protein